MNHLLGIYKRCFCLIIPFLFVGATVSATTVKTVGNTGAGADYATIAAAYATCTAATDYVIDIRSDYTLEALPITLGALINKSSVNTVTIRPQTGVGSLSMSASTTRVFYLNGANWVIIDGRAGGAGSSVMTIENTNTAASVYAIRFENDASNNIIKYCTVKGASNYGTIYFAATTGTTGSDNNAIDNCTITKSGANVPLYGVHSVGTATKENDNITISNCSITEFTTNGIYEESNSDVWTITGNSFYLAAAYTPGANMACIYLNDGTSHTVTGNFFGGKSANCGGTAYTLNSSAFYLTCIYFSATITAGTCTITGNTIKNFSISTNAASFSFVGIYCGGAGNYIVGAAGAGNGNAIGDTVSGTGNIVVTSAGASSHLFRGIRVLSSGTNNVKYNAMGSITCNGTATGTTLSRFIEVTSAAGVTNVQYNKIGNATAANISLPVTTNPYDFDGIYFNSNQNSSISNNTIQNISSLGTSAPQGSGITVSGSGVYTVNNNSITNSVFSSPLFGIDVNSTNVGGTCTVNGNTIQSYTVTAAGSPAYCSRGIYCQGTANYIIGATGAGNGNCIGDTVSGTGNIVITASATPTEIFSGIYSSATGTHNISGNSMGSLTFNGAATTSASVTFIAATASSSSTIQRNTIGNATANNISFPVTTSHYDFQGITCAAGASAIDYNTIRNINNLGNTQLIQNGIEVTGSSLVSVSYNSLTNAVFNSPHYSIYATSTYTANTCTVNGNTVNTLTVTTSAGTYPFMAINCTGSANFIIGTAGAGNGNCIGDTVSGTGNITITVSGARSHIFRGIRISSTGTNSVKYNALGSITCNGSATGTPISRFIEVVGTSPATGATSVQYNTIGNPATLANISFPVAGNLYGYCGIVYDANSNGNISYNKFQNISNLGTGDVGENECIKVTGDGTYTVSYNTVGNTTANNIVYASNMLMHGIWFTNTTGTFTAQGNYIQNFNCTSTGAATYYHGQCIDGGGSVNFTQDTVRNISIAGTNTASPDCLIQGLRVINNSANQVIDKCAVKDMTSTSTTASITMIGIYTGPTGSCTGDLTRCHISGLVVASDGATANNYGMYLAASGSWNAYNNVVLLDNGGNKSPTIAGIVSASTGASTLNIFHNSVKIYGTGANSTAALNSMAYYRLSAGGSSITNVKNNVWQNLRTGGTGKHYACRIGITSNLTCDYNYLENTVAANFAYSGGDIGSLAAWNALAYVGNDVTGTVTLENVKGFSSNAPIPNGGIAPLTPAVTEDKEAYTRANPNPWIGAWENIPSTLPVEMLSFRAACKEGEAELKWTTATETNNNYFSIERSTDGKVFQPIGKVYGAGNSSVSRSYEFIDNEIISNGILFYRIRQVDYDNQFEYFGPVSVRCNSSGIEINPTVSDGIFFITGDISDAEISICSVIGENIFFGARHSLSSAIDLSSQASGIYFVKIKTEQGVEVKKIVVKH